MFHCSPRMTSAEILARLTALEVLRVHDTLTAHEARELERLTVEWRNRRLAGVL